MAESAKIRLVRCPKCENLLPEVTNYSVYQCGGCGAVLRAKNRGKESEAAVSDKSDEGRIVGTVHKKQHLLTTAKTDSHNDDDDDDDDDDKMSNLSEGVRAIEISDGSQTDVRSSISSSTRKISRRGGENPQQAETAAKICQEFDVLANFEENGHPPRIVGNGSKNDEDEFMDNADYNDCDRAELLKKLDELKAQLSRSGNLVDKGKEKVSYPYSWQHPDEANRPPFIRQPYQNPYAEPPPRIPRRDIGGCGFYTPPGYGDPSRPQMHRRGPYPYQMYPFPSYGPGSYPDDGMGYMDPVEPYPTRHHRSCLCYQCHQRRQVSTAYPDVPNDRIFGYRDNSRSSARLLHRRWPSDVDFESDGFVHRRPTRVHLLSGGKRCRPMAGGVPFLTCYNCFEVLLVPKRVFAADENGRKKMRCGACSTLIVFMVSNRSLVVLNDVVEGKDDLEEVEEVVPISKHPNRARTGTTFSSDDYENYGYDLNSMGQANRSTESNNRHSTSTYTSEADEDSGSANRSAKNAGPSPPLGSSLQDHFEFSNKNQNPNQNRTREGNRSGRSEHDKSELNKTTSRQMSGKESLASEIDLSSNEFGNTVVTVDSGEGSQEGEHLKISKVAESFFAGIIKKSFKDKSNDGSDQDKANVTVNGHAIPSRVLKKAEKVAGSILPGHYWYDFRAGFWGVMGGPCLGIIPPSIEEFNYPMPENCAGGNTSVFVNGRELNQKDLALLGSRGLPTERGQSYIIEISGRVLDEDTGQELDGLGKLAPTVERMKRGFGMKAPKPTA